MNKLRSASVVVGAVAAVAVGGAAFAAGGSPSPAATDDHGGSVRLLPDGDVSPSPADDHPSPEGSAGVGTLVSPTVGTAVSPGPSTAVAISIDRAKAIAIRAAGGGYVRKVEKETEQGRAVWDVDVIAGGVEHDIDVDRATGAVLQNRVRSSGGSTGGASEPAARVTHDAGDDHGSAGHSADDRTGDDRGGHGADDPAGDDHGGRKGGSDDRAGDDGGARKGGSDDRAGDDHGGRKGGSDDKGGDDKGR